MIKYIFAVTVLSAGLAFAANNQPAGPIAKEVRHELVMLPYLDVFDNLSYGVDGGVVTSRFCDGVCHHRIMDCAAARGDTFFWKIESA